MGEPTNQATVKRINPSDLSQTMLMSPSGQTWPFLPLEWQKKKKKKRSFTSYFIHRWALQPLGDPSVAAVFWSCFKIWLKYERWCAEQTCAFNFHHPCTLHITDRFQSSLASKLLESGHSAGKQANKTKGFLVYVSHKKCSFPVNALIAHKEWDARAASRFWFQERGQGLSITRAFGSRFCRDKVS